MTRRRSYPNPSRLAKTVRELVADLEAIPPMYARLHDLTGTSPRRESVAVLRGGDSDPTGELAMPVRVDEGLDPEKQVAIGETETERRRKHARRVAGDLERLARTVAQLRDGLELHVGPGPGFRQATKVAGGLGLSQNDLAESLAKQEARIRSGVE